jgi:transglutaminase-like putative cysteine protease
MSEVVRYRVRHETEYRYGGDVAHSHQLLHLTPRDTLYQTCHSRQLSIEPEPGARREETDAFGNRFTRLEFDKPHDRLEVLAEMRVEVRAPGETRPEDSEPWEKVSELLRYFARPLSAAALEACRFRMESGHVRVKHVLTEYGDDCFTARRPVLAAADALMHKIHRDFRYVPGSTTVRTSALEAFEARRGVCQDFAHVMIGCCRARGVAARYVSGYLRTLPPPGADAGFVGADASHAWASVYCPPLGWVDLDPTNDVRVGSGHIVIAWGRDFGDVSPLRGVIVGGGRHNLSVRVSVQAE